MDKNNKYINVIVGIFLVLVTTVALVLVVSNVACRVRKVSNIKQVDIDSYLEMKETEYYVFVYAMDAANMNLYTDIVIEYANYAKAHSSAKKIYALDYNTSKNQSISTTIDTSFKVDEDLPCLLLIKDGKVSSKYKTYSELDNTLTKAMGR